MKENYYIDFSILSDRIVRYYGVEVDMKRSIYQNIWSVCIFFISLSCTQYPADELLSAPEQIEINGRESILDAYFRRDFFPPHPPNGRPLDGIIYVIATDSLQFPSSLDANFAWVIKDNDVWGTGLEDGMPPFYEYILKKRTTEEGPKWGPYIYVDVVVRIVDNYDSTYLLKVSDVWIHRTE